ncbi:ATP-binding cassette domain-containing protein [Leucobacter aridicollis]|uniref:ABC-2 type transport system ATP-binding protein n=1 Tax=Leucobacter aridicollis TaxID=283878 RepID=A0A852REM1_9MICO|nr:ATP-binding cassette domain-containing protein [Leucobacter aridicollis]MBL3682196.1 ABC transporter ATP-binding protein [Leucobacter aridicollis]NYD26754.1 ABC-2 type transport system ATP-binding protein [Leucobacter aridicollis]
MGAHVELDEVTVSGAGRLRLGPFTGTFAPSSVTAVIGGDGAGKSTLLSLLAGRLSPASGSLTGLPTDRHRVGYQPADSGVWRNLSVAENLDFVTNVYGLDRAYARARASEMLSRAGLLGAEDRLAGRLSGGMRQKLGIILATLHEPDLVLLDEPTTGVDPISRSEVWRLIAGTAAAGATVVFATTYLDEAERANSLFLLGEGTVLAAGDASAVASATPGRVWLAPVAAADSAPVLRRGTSWRRGTDAYSWTASDGEAPGPSFRPAPIDVETASIALLLARGAPTADSPAVRVGLSGPLRDEGQPAGKGTQRVLASAAGVSRYYGTHAALTGVSLEVSQGEIVGLLGGNGAGKTTLIRALLGLEAVDAGATTLLGGAPTLAARRRLGYVSQGLGLYPGLTARENVEFAASVFGVAAPPATLSLAASFGRRPVATLPLGTRRRIAAAVAMLHDPELLVLDEPTSGMDALSRAELWKSLRLRADDGMGILVSRHYMQEAEQCDRLVILGDGVVVAAGSVAEITAAQHSVAVIAERWDEAFARLDAGGVPVLLDGRTVRLPGADPRVVSEALSGIDAKVARVPATLDETMLLDSLRAERRGGGPALG